MHKVTRYLATIFGPSPPCSEKDREYLQDYDVEPYTGGLHASESTDEMDDDSDDALSISTISTMATMDNIPSSGQAVEYYIYQFFGRKIERFTNRLSISYLAPHKIAQCLWPKSDGNILLDEPSSLRNIERDDLSEPHFLCDPEVRMAGLKSLVKQTQSNSLYRSSAALVALIRLATTCSEYNEFYFSVSAVEPIFHLETLAMSLSDFNREKKWFLALGGLARAHLHTRDTAVLTSEVTRSLRHNVLRILDSVRSHNEPLVVTSDASLLFAKCAGFLRDQASFKPDPDLGDVWEATYFLAVFLLQSFVRLTTESNPSFYREPGSHQLESLVLSTQIRWFCYVLTSCTLGLPLMKYPWAAQHAYTLNSVLDIGIHVGVLPHPTLSSLKKRQLIDPHVLPRRVRNMTRTGEDPPTIRQHYMQACTRRTCRLLASFEELERELRDTSFARHAAPQSSIDKSRKEDMDEDLQRSLDCARQVQVLENDLTQEFFEARRSTEESNGIKRWRDYKEVSHLRHGWGKFCRSNMEWDWVSASCLRRLFEIEKPDEQAYEASRLSGSIRAIIHADETSGRRLDVSGTDPESVLPEIDHYQYTTKTGEIKCRRFVAYPLVEDVSSSAEISEPPCFLSQTHAKFAVAATAPKDTSTNFREAESTSDSTTKEVAYEPPETDEGEDFESRE